MQWVVRSLLFIAIIACFTMVLMVITAEKYTFATSWAPLDVYGPVLQSPDGSHIWEGQPLGITPTSFLKVGQQYVIFVNATDLVPELDKWPGTNVGHAAMIVKVSDYYSNDIELLAWTTGIGKDGNPMVMAVSWTPDRVSQYEVSTFVVTGFENPVVLSEVNTTWFVTRE